MGVRKGIIFSLFLVVYIPGNAQPDLDKLIGNYDEFKRQWPKTNIHLVFNQNKYSPGDTAYFKAYVLTENLYGVEGKQLIHLNLVDAQGRSRNHLLFAIVDGIGYNQIVIPENLPAGYYNVVAYTNWTKNFETASLFKKQISVVQNNELANTDKQPKVVVEGGHLVGEVFSRVIIQSHEPETIVQLTDDNDLTLQTTKTNEFGFASLTLKPHNSKKYFVKVMGDNGTPIQLPIVEEDGCSILLTPAKLNEPVKILVSVPLASQYRQEQLIIVVTQQGKIKNSSAFKFGEKEFLALQISTEELSQGIASISILTITGKLLTHRDFYIYKADQPLVKIKTDRAYYSPRAKIALGVSLTDAEGTPLAGEFAVTVINNSVLDNDDSGSHFEFQERLFFNDINTSDSLGNYLLNVDHQLISTSKDIPWREIVAGKFKEPRFAASTALEKRGIAYLGDTDEPLPDLSKVLFYLQKNGWRYQTLILDGGQVWLTLPDFYGEDELFILAETKNGNEIKKIRIDWKEDKSVELPAAVPAIETKSPDAYASFSKNTRLINQSFGFFKTSLQLEASSTAGEENKLQPQADVEVNTQDYLLFPTMIETIREIVPSLFVRIYGKDTLVRISLSQPMISVADPLYLIDGKATKNTRLFLSLKPEDVIAIEVVNSSKKLLPLGLLGKNGIVRVKTKLGTEREPIDPSNLVRGLSKPIDFIVKDSVNEIRRHKPDFRSTIYWNPFIKTDERGEAIVEFDSSDDIAPIMIWVTGMTLDGKPFSATHTVEIKDGLKGQ